MSAVKQLNLTIDGKAVQAASGQTLFEAASAAGIYIPALCHHSKLPPLGACRLCLVEVEGQRALHPACTYPAAEGLVVRTESARLRAARLTALQLLFSERGHYCMVCPMSGSAQTTDCELQRLGYEMGITSWPYPPNTAKRWAVDSSHPNVIVDHARCVLCRRCIRACDHLAAAHALGIHYRGARAMIGADDDVPLGQSSCISCGMCIQVCPTGAITDRRSAYAGHDAEVRHVKSACVGCAAACGIDAAVRDNQLLRIDGDWNASSGGLLCQTGRFKSTQSPGRRITEPRIGVNGQTAPATWDQAIAHIARKLGDIAGIAASGAGNGNDPGIAGLISPRLPTESLAAFTYFFHEVLGSDQVALLYGDAPPADLGRPATLADVGQSDCIVIIGQDPIVQHPVVGYLIKRAFDRGAKIVVVDDEHTTLDDYATLHLHLQEIAAHAESPFARLKNIYHLRMSGIKQLSSAVATATRPVLVYGWGLSTMLYAALRSLPDKVRFLPLVRGANTRGAGRLGLAARPVQGQTMLALLGDEPPPADAIPTGVSFLVVQAACESAWTAIADVVLPARTWNEQWGHVTSLEGRNCRIEALTASPEGVRGEGEVLKAIAQQLGRELSYDEICRVLAAAPEGESR